jgi:hypothetical protein
VYCVYCVYCVCCRWQLEKSKTALKVVPLCVGLASSVPCTRLRIDETGTYLAVGASDGVVAVLGANDLRTVASYPCHDLPVTGMWFAPPALAHTLGKELDLSAVFAWIYTGILMPIQFLFVFL